MSRSLPIRLMASLAASLALALLAVATVATVPAKAGHSDETTSAAIYRIPYLDGTLVDTSGDAHNHGGAGGARDRIDLRAVDGNGTEIAADIDADTDGDGSAAANPGDPFALIVAAASGTIAVIEDDHGDDYGRGDGLTAALAPQPDDSVEHICQNNAVLPGSETCPQHNNYLWIAHPNGEWTKYSHFRTGTVTVDRNWSVGDSVQVGDVLGEEGNVGFASGTHLHYEVAELGPYGNYDTDGDGIPETLPANIGNPGGFISTNAFENHNPRVCDATTPDFEYVDDNDASTALTAGQCLNTPPVADAGDDVLLAEGATVELDGTGSSDIHNAVLTYSWSPATNLDDQTSPTPTYRGIDDAADMIDLTVSDVGGDVSAAEALTDTDTVNVTVENVAPTVTIDPAQTTLIDEHGTVSVVAEFVDPGILDTHGATIDWGAPAGDEGVELAPPTIQILDPGGPDQPMTGRVTGTYRYGDNDDGAGFAIEVTVTDDDFGSDTAGFALTVGNIDPTPEIDLSGAVLVNGVPTIIGEAGVPVDLSGRAGDPGSDDLAFEWSFGDGETASTLSRVNPPLDDFLPSPTVQPRVDVADLQEHTFGDACMYETSLQVADDDAGVGPPAVATVLIAGNADDSRPAGWWQTQYDFVGMPSDFSVETLACYLAIARFGSAVFDEERALATLDDAESVLHKQGTLGQHQKNLDRELLTAWLNFANGVFDYQQLVVDTDNDGAADLSFADALAAAETVRLDPAATTEELVAARQLVHEVNQP